MHRVPGSGASKENGLVPEAMSYSTPSLPYATLLPYADPAYRPPEPDEIRAVMQLLGTTAEQLAGIVGVKDGRAVRRWLSPSTAKTHAQIDYAIWRLMLLEAGLIEAPKPLIHAKTIRSKDLYWIYRKSSQRQDKCPFIGCLVSESCLTNVREI
jgi:hypothetical protein